MTRVFIGGSRHVSHLNASVRTRLDKIVDKAFPVLVGDANGADKALQEYLHTKNYKHVVVYCVGGVCRNNVGRWQHRDIPADTRNRNAQFFSAKDRVMADEATFGLMVWDGKSIGTLLNVYRLIVQGKTAVVYFVPDKRFIDFKVASHWEDFIARCETDLRHKVEQRISLEGPSKDRPSQAALHI
jgi:hypothetical protein